MAKSTPRAARSAPRAAKSTPRVPQERPGEAFLEVFRWFHGHSVKITFLNENNLIRLRILFDMICITENVLKRRFPFTAGSVFFYVGAFLASKIDQKIDSKINMFFDCFWTVFGPILEAQIDPRWAKLGLRRLLKRYVLKKVNFHEKL